MLENLTPSLVWQYFEEITKVPRPSKKEEKIIEYLIKFATDNKLEYKKDLAGNVVIYGAATAGYENCEALILQSHMDMVCEKDSAVNFDFENDPLNIYIEDGLVRAKGTTLGADCGIGMAVAMALLTDNKVQRPALEALFTVDEETGLTGAMELDFSMLSSKKLINLDSEDEGELFIGCAGGIDTIGRFDFRREPILGDHLIIELSVEGLLGGHSGDDINKLRGNAVVLLSRFLLDNIDKYNIMVLDIKGGALRNAIPREAVATIAVTSNMIDSLEESVNNYRKTIKNEYCRSEKGLDFNWDIVDKIGGFEIIDPVVINNLLKTIITIPSGVFAMSQDIDNFVESSTNTASLKIEGDQIVVSTSQRSSLESRKEQISTIVRTLFETYGANVQHSDGYPGWQPNADSSLLIEFETAYQKLFNKSIAVKAVHAGLECGLFGEKCEGLDMVSVGPTVRGAHSPSENLDINSVSKFWDLMVEVLKNMNN